LTLVAWVFLAQLNSLLNEVVDIVGLVLGLLSFARASHLILLFLVAILIKLEATRFNYCELIY
jgi:hypothetical protein